MLPAIDILGRCCTAHEWYTMFDGHVLTAARKDGSRGTYAVTLNDWTFELADDARIVQVDGYCPDIAWVQRSVDLRYFPTETTEILIRTNLGAERTSYHSPHEVQQYDPVAKVLHVTFSKRPSHCWYRHSSVLVLGCDRRNRLTSMNFEGIARP